VFVKRTVIAFQLIGDASAQAALAGKKTKEHPQAVGQFLCTESLIQKGGGNMWVAVCHWTAE
jgi:hypothetical protein